MTVSELREHLEDLEHEGHGDKEVYAACDYGDYSHTMQLIETEYPTVIKPAETAYSHTGLCIARDGEDSDLDEVVILMDECA